VCANEQNLIDIACKKYDFVPVLLEDMKWRDQISLFRNADVIVGLAGSGLHNALFSNRESRLASVGMLNLVQSQIGALRGQRNAFLSKGIVLSREFSVDEDVFGTFLKAVCDSS
jgi:capsular polysaccharide biosynthesis protein